MLSTKPQLSVALLEAQHETITSAINRLADHPTQDTSGEEFSLWMTRFVSMLAEHFSAEEQLMEQLVIDLDSRNVVKKEHNRLLGMQLGIVDSMMHGLHLPLSQVAKKFSTELTTHIAEHDHKYF